MLIESGEFQSFSLLKYITLEKKRYNLYPYITGFNSLESMQALKHIMKNYLLIFLQILEPKRKWYNFGNNGWVGVKYICEGSSQGLKVIRFVKVRKEFQFLEVIVTKKLTCNSV